MISNGAAVAAILVFTAVAGDGLHIVHPFCGSLACKRLLSLKVKFKMDSLPQFAHNWSFLHANLVAHPQT